MSLKKLRILISVFDKTGLTNFVGKLREYNDLDIVSSGGTAAHLEEAGFSVEPVESITDFPEILSGRVKTLHPKIHGGILADQENEDHMNELKKHSIEPFHMVVVNLYPFEKTIAKEGVTLEEAIEQIDIGGVALLRAAAKNFTSIIPVCDKEDYEDIANLLSGNEIPEDKRKELATKVFFYTSSYDTAIANFLKK